MLKTSQTTKHLTKHLSVTMLGTTGRWWDNLFQQNSLTQAVTSFAVGPNVGERRCTHRGGPNTPGEPKQLASTQIIKHCSRPENLHKVFTTVAHIQNSQTSSLIFISFYYY